jgi:hypothetical protein
MEAHVSEVVYIDSDESLDQLAKRSTHVVVVSLDASSKSPREELLREVVFPKETHFEKREPSIFREFAEAWNVSEVLKSPSIKPGPIKVYTAPDYGEGASRAYHELNQTESPIIRRYKSTRPPKDGPNGSKKRILFLADYQAHGDEKIAGAIYEFKAAEGIEALEAVKKALLPAAAK